MYTKFWSETLEGMNHVGEVGINGRITLTLILQKLNVRVWLNANSL